MPVRDVIVVGAGPAGLAAAIAAAKRGLDYVVVEKGALVDAIYRFPTNMVFFTTADLLEIGGLPFVTPYDKPTRLEALRYYRRVVDALGLNVELGVAVTAIHGAPGGGFALETAIDGLRETLHARAVVAAIGYYDQPNIIGVPGEDLPHVAHYYKEAHPFYRKRVVVVGGANSAAEAALEMYRAGARVTVVHRNEAFSASIKYWVLPDLQNRVKEGAIASRLGASVTEILPNAVIVEQGGSREEIPADAVFLLTGYRTDARLLKAAGVRFDDCNWMPYYDPETFETNVRNLFLAGGVISGRNTAPIFIENGRFHGEKAMAVVAGRLGRQ